MGIQNSERDDLHWLTIPQRVEYKLAVTVHRCLRYRAPRYLADCCVTVSEVSGRQYLHSASRRKLNIHRFVSAHLAPGPSQSPVQRLGTHCLIRCVTRLLWILVHCFGRMKQLTPGMNGYNNKYLTSVVLDKNVIFVFVEEYISPTPFIIVFLSCHTLLRLLGPMALSIFHCFSKL